MEFETEEQQVEALKRWWAENGRSVLLGVAIGAVAILGWQWWNKHKLKQAQAASDQFQQSIEAINSDSNAAEHAAALRDDHGGTLYASMASLAAARDLVQAGDLEAAEKELQLAAKGSPQDEVALIAKIRLARVQGALGKVDEALSSLPGKPPTPFTALVEEVRGDLYVAKGEPDKARTAYQAALDSNQRSADSNALNMKLNELATANDAS